MAHQQLLAGRDRLRPDRLLPDGGVAVRHSKDPDGSVLLYTSREWDAFLKGAKDGEFDLA